MEENNKMIYKKIFKNLITAVLVGVYFFITNFLFVKVDKSIIINSSKIVSIIILFCAIVIFEIAYKKDRGDIAITGIEILVLALNVLISWNIIIKNNIRIID